MPLAEVFSIPRLLGSIPSVIVVVVRVIDADDDRRSAVRGWSSKHRRSRDRPR
jgi:hypothetical protein